MTTLLIIFIAVALVAGIVASESNSVIFSTAVILSFFAVLELAFDVPIWAAIVANPLTVVALLLAYLVAGAVYAMVWRWPEYLRNKSEAIKSEYARYVRENKVDNVDEFINDNYYNSYSASRNSDYIANWVMSWPLSLAWELARKPAIWTWKTVYSLLSGYFEGISKRTIKKVLNDK
jgi:hypothetical protein